MRNWRAYLIPALTFQSVLIGGGYATGRELIAFFSPSGPVGGIFGLLVAGGVFALVLGIAYEFARTTRTYDYRSFCKRLIGPGWILYEAAYLALVVVVLAVIGSASGELVRQALDMPPIAGTFGMACLVGALTYMGSQTISNFFAVWSVALYAAYIALFLITFINFNTEIIATFSRADTTGGWALAGTRYAGYNISLPAVLFCIPLLKSRRQSFGAGLATGVLAVLPAIIFYIAMMSHYPEITLQAVPALFLMNQLQTPWLEAVFHLVIFGTFVETGTGLLHAINERIDKQAAENARSMPQWLRPAIAASLLLLSVYAADRVGIVDLIASGYGVLSWVFIVLLIIPLLTLGIWRIVRTPG